MNNIKLLPSLLIFAEVANRGSFTDAARHLGMSKSAVSQHISRLEEQMGTQLLSRNTRGMSLTANGAKLLSRSESLKDQVDMAFQELASAEEVPSGVFSITSPQVMHKEVTAPALRQLCIEFPQLQPRVVVTDEVLDLIKENLDVAMFGGELPDSNYRALPVGTVTEIFYASPTYIQQYGEPEKPADLINHRCLSADWQDDIKTIFCTKDNTEERIELKPYVRSNSFACIEEMVRQDMGVGLLSPITCEEYVRKGQLKRILKNYHGKKWPTYIVHPFKGEKPIHVTRFYQLVKYYFTKTNRVSE